MRWFERAEAHGFEPAKDVIRRTKGVLLFADGVAAARDERFQTARARWLESAALGDPDAMMDLGLLYENGDGVALDLETALSWYEKAAAAGKVNAPEAVERIKKRIAHVTELEKNAASKK